MSKRELNLVKRVFTRLDYFFAFGFGSGLLPYVPGTWGTLAAIPLYILMTHVSLLTYSVVVSVAFLAGIWICKQVSNDMRVHDFSGIVWDEIVGYLLTMWGLPYGITWIVAGFCLFRFFDIVKPGPIGWIDHSVKGGLGIMLDDVAAAIPAGLILHACACWMSLS